MKKSILILLTASAYSFFCFGGENKELLQPTIDLFEQQVVQFMEQSKVPGLAIVVTHAGKTIYSKGFGYRDLETADPVTKDTLFRLASNTKMLTAIAILQIWEKGLIEIDQPVVKYLPWFKLNDPADRWKKITIRQLLNHTSGVSRCEGSNIWENEKFLLTGCLPSSEEMLPGAMNQEMVLDPGSRLRYSNLGYWILSQIIAEYGGTVGKSSDEKYINYVKEHILKPLQMDHSGFIIDLSKNQHAKSYGQIDKGTGVRAQLTSIINPSGSSATGGLYSSVNDISKFLIWLTSAFQGKSVLLLKSSTGAMMTSNPVADPNSSYQYGLGIMINTGSNGLIMGHGGSFPGFKTHIMVDAQSGIGIAILINTDADSMKFWNLAFKTIGNALLKLPPELPAAEQPPKTSAVSPNTLSPFKNIVGRYKEDMWGEYIINEDSKGTLWFDLIGRLSMHPIHQSPRRLDFRMGWEGSFVTFVGERVSIFLDEEGKVDYLLIGNTFRVRRIGDL